MNSCGTFPRGKLDLMRLLLTCTISVALQAAEPVTSAWIMARPAASEQLRKVLPEVHEVMVEKDFVEVRSAGLSLTFLGPFQNPLTGNGGVRELRFRIPRRPAIAGATSESQWVGPGAMGVFRNGVPLYNRFAEASYLGQNLWHFDTVALRDPERPLSFGALEPMMADGSTHSPLLGFALDGFPIYGPWGFANPDGTSGLARMRSGYRLRKILHRTTWPGGQQLTPGQYGPPVNEAFPQGTFAEDYEYVPAAGDLDASNGRFSVTPDYPEGTYSYFLTADDRNQPVFPYFLADRFQGKIPGPGAAAADSRLGVKFGHGELLAGTPAELTFTFPSARFLEIVHEKPLHVMIVSSDLETFEHIHPEWKLGGFYAVSHSFPRAGKYRLFAQFTRPGEPERLEVFDLAVIGKHAGGAPARQIQVLAAKLRKPDRIRTGEDVPFTVELSGEPIEPYLGAWGHFVLLDQGAENFIHAHPAESAGAAPDPGRPHIHGVSDVAAGPPPAAVSFTTNFSKAGRYKLWAQFQVAGQPAVYPFTVDVSSGVPVSVSHQRIPADAVRIAVDSRGFTPARIEVSSGIPLTLAVTRAATPNCGIQIVFPALDIKRELPVGETTLIELPKLTGDLSFACGMGMYRGLIVVR